MLVLVVSFFPGGKLVIVVMVEDQDDRILFPKAWAANIDRKRCAVETSLHHVIFLNLFTHQVTDKARKFLLT